MNSNGFLRSLDTRLEATEALSKVHNYELTGQQRLDAIGARLEASGVGRIHFTYGDTAHLLSADELADKKADYLTAYFNGEGLERTFMIDTEDESGHLRALEKAWNVLHKAGFQEHADKIEEIIEQMMAAEWAKR